MLQEILNMSVDTAPTFDNYWSESGSNNDKIKCLLQNSTFNNDCSEHYYLVGDSATGKSHLLQALANDSNKVLLIDLSCQDYNNISINQELDHYQLIAIDHLDAKIDSHHFQHWLFKLFNYCSGNTKSLIITANQVPNFLPIALADLKSRLQSITLLPLTSLDDELKTKILTFRAERQGLSFDNKTLSYLMNRSERDLHILMYYLDEFSKEGLRNQKKLGISLIKETLNW